MPAQNDRREHRLELARQLARRIHHRYGVVAPEHIRLEAICAACRVKLEVTKLDGADAQLVRAGHNVTILVSDRSTDREKQRFDIAHELGHYLLGHRIRIPSRIPGPEVPRTSLEEREASTFASELLMPEELVRERCDLSRGDLAGPRQISRDYNVSILSSAIRFAELATERCAAVFSIADQAGGGRVKWVASSGSLDLPIRSGRPLSDLSLASSFYATGALDEDTREVSPSAWFDAIRPGDRVVEHAISRPDLRTVLSMLWVQRAA